MYPLCAYTCMSLLCAFCYQMSASARGVTDYSVPDVESCFLPKPSFQPQAEYLQTLTAIYMVIAYAPMVSIFVSNLVTEKEKKIKVGMKMMGLADVSLWLAWGITYGLVMLAASGIITLISVATKLFSPTQNFLVFLLLFLYGLSVMAFSFALVPFFNKASVASAAGSMSTILFSLFYLLVVNVETSLGVKYLLSIFSPTALGLGLGEIVYLDSIGEGLQFDNIATAGSSFPIRGAFIMITVDIILYMLLAMYFDRVIPDEYGKSWSPFFFLKPSFFLNCCRGRQGFSRLEVDAEHGTGVSYGTIESSSSVSLRTASAKPLDPLPESDDVEVVSSKLKKKAAIQIRGLRKVFSKSKISALCSKGEQDVTVAVDDVSLDAYEGEITALLGHNGAGKSTLINMLTGMVDPSCGVARIYGHDVDDANELETIRQFTGVCPQHDILYDELTVREHLELFARIKGIPAHEEAQAVKKIIDEITLTEKADSLATTLSGGQKRKLSVGIALIGDPRIVFLDEPTSGMDPLSRRQLWSLLKKSRQDKIIFLTTHFMDEADILAGECSCHCFECVCILRIFCFCFAYGKTSSL